MKEQDLFNIIEGLGGEKFDNVMTLGKVTIIPWVYSEDDKEDVELVKVTTDTFCFTIKSYQLYGMKVVFRNRKAYLTITGSDYSEFRDIDIQLA